MAQDYTDRQKHFVHDDEVMRLEMFLDQFLKENVGDTSFIDSALLLLLKVQQEHRQGKLLTKTQACRLIKSRNPSVCQKYVEEAERRGFIKILPDPKDGRRQLVHPEPVLLTFVDQHVRDVASQAQQLVAVTASIDPLPDNNQLMHGYELHVAPEGLLSRKQDREMQLRGFVRSMAARFNPLNIGRV